jgi:hypothetical protein
MSVVITTVVDMSVVITTVVDMFVWWGPPVPNISRSSEECNNARSTRATQENSNGTFPLEAEALGFFR